MVEPISPHRRGGFFVWGVDSGGVRVRFLGRGPELDREESLRRAAGPGPRVAALRQVHSAEVRPAAPGFCGRGDALVTSRPGLAPSVITADCVPLLLASPASVAAVHAGWRGIVAGVVSSALARLDEPDRAAAWIGPAIGPCCYEVGPEVADQVVAAAGPEVVRPGPGPRPHLDLRLAVARQLAHRGVTRVHQVGPCTRCHPELLWSYRRDGERAGRNIAYIWRDGSP
ncbi:MAG TPA: polyphenol oxidase family protein [Thermoanaerobaculia bacterium]|nr:polyphenol oxidase family protein [Thermoanaerobaculia bacterium]